MIAMLARWARPRPTTALRVVVYTRAECCCCHTALDLLGEYRRHHRLEIEQVDVDSNPELAALHGLTVPVVEIDGKVRFRGVVNRVLLERLLAAKRERRTD